MSPLSPYAFADIEASAPRPELPSVRQSPEARAELHAKVRAYVARCCVGDFMGTRYVLLPDETPRAQHASRSCAVGEVVAGGVGLSPGAGSPSRTTTT